MIYQLDLSLLLESKRVHDARAEFLREWNQSPVRAPALAGHGYPANRRELVQLVDGILAGPSPSVAVENIVAVVAPHIDVALGRRVYGAAYRTILNCKPEQVLVLGTGHTMESGLFTFTTKDFETPLGRIEVDRAAVKQLSKAAASLAAPNDLAHRREHSIEFQLVFLQRVLATRRFSLIPLLCGTLEPYLARYSSFAEIPGMDEFLHALREITEDESTLVVAGVDLAHIGPKFGDPLPARQIEVEAKDSDLRLLEAVCARDGQRYWAELRTGSNRHHVCGAAALACLTAMLPPSVGSVLDYELWHEEATRSAVSFAAVLFERETPSNPNKSQGDA
ncbi:MAG: AmmeMemoRadiSam system protein B [Kiritimatiellia bacterium]